MGNGMKQCYGMYIKYKSMYDMRIWNEINAHGVCKGKGWMWNIYASVMYINKDCYNGYEWE